MQFLLSTLFCDFRVLCTTFVVFFLHKMSKLKRPAGLRTSTEAQADHSRTQEAQSVVRRRVICRGRCNGSVGGWERRCTVSCTVSMIKRLMIVKEE